MHGNIGLMQNLLNNVKEKILFILNQLDILSHCFIPAISSVKKNHREQESPDITNLSSRPPPQNFTWLFSREYEISTLKVH